MVRIANERGSAGGELMGWQRMIRQARGPSGRWAYSVHIITNADRVQEEKWATRKIFWGGGESPEFPLFLAFVIEASFPLDMDCFGLLGCGA
jgi:hypothetical protein